MSDSFDPCHLHRVLGHEAVCPGESCAFWWEPAGACVLDAAQAELTDRPEVARHLLELRATLEGAAAGTAGKESR